MFDTVVCVCTCVRSDDLDRKMDHKRQQIHSGGQEIRQLEKKVNQLTGEKVHTLHNILYTHVHYIKYVCLTLFFR